MNKYLKTMKENYLYGIMILLVIISIVLGCFLYKQNK